MNLQQLAALASLITSVGPYFTDLIKLIFTTVRAVEAAFPDSPGKTKFDVAVNQITGVVGALESNALPALSGLINGAVAALNAIGEFKKKSSEPMPG